MQGNYLEIVFADGRTSVFSMDDIDFAVTSVGLCIHFLETNSQGNHVIRMYPWNAISSVAHSTSVEPEFSKYNNEMPVRN